MPHQLSIASSSSALDVAHIAGNASPRTKRALANPAKFFENRYPDIIKKPIFSESIYNRMQVVEISVSPNTDEPNKSQARVVVEIEVVEDMLNPKATVHAACSAFLIDMCSTLALTALLFETKGEMFHGVTQSMNFTCHSPASLGDKLRIVNTSVGEGARALSARTEIWNATGHRLVCSGTQIKMRPREPQTGKSKL